LNICYFGNREKEKSDSKEKNLCEIIALKDHCIEKLEKATAHQGHVINELLARYSPLFYYWPGILHSFITGQVFCILLLLARYSALFNYWPGILQSLITGQVFCNL